MVLLAVRPRPGRRSDGPVLMPADPTLPHCSIPGCPHRATATPLPRPSRLPPPALHAPALCPNHRTRYTGRPDR